VSIQLNIVTGAKRIQRNTYETVLMLVLCVIVVTVLLSCCGLLRWRRVLMCSLHLHQLLDLFRLRTTRLWLTGARQTITRPSINTMSSEHRTVCVFVMEA